MKVTAIQGLFIKNVTPVYLGQIPYIPKTVWYTFPTKECFPSIHPISLYLRKWAHLLCTARVQRDEGGVREKWLPLSCMIACSLFKLKMQIQKRICLEVTVKEGSKKCSFDVFYVQSCAYLELVESYNCFWINEHRI